METVDFETPACFATSDIVVPIFLLHIFSIFTLFHFMLCTGKLSVNRSSKPIYQ